MTETAPLNGCLRCFKEPCATGFRSRGTEEWNIGTLVERGGLPEWVAKNTYNLRLLNPRQTEIPPRAWGSDDTEVYAVLCRECAASTGAKVGAPLSDAPTYRMKGTE